MIAILFYLGISLYFGRKNPFFYLIFPHALLQGEAAFINQRISIAGKYILSPYATVFGDAAFVITALIAIFLMKIRYKKVPWAGTKLITVFMVYIVFLWLRTFLGYSRTSEVFLTGRIFFYLSLSYFLWVAIYESVTRDQYEKFLKLTFYVTPVSTLLYILNSSKVLPLFDESLIYQELDFGAGTFLRDFRTIPIWLVPVLVLSFLSILTKTIQVNRNIVMLNIFILPIGILFTFTRSILISVLVQVAFLLLLYGFKLNGKMIKNLVMFAFFLGASYVGIQTIFPSQLNYFGDRMTSVKTEGKEEGNVNIRFQYLDEAMKIGNETNDWIGAGMDRKYYPRMDSIGAWNADSTIPYYLIHTGWIGVLLIFGIILVFFVDSLFLYFRTKDWLVAFLCGYFFVLFVSSLLMGGDALVGNLWSMVYFALYSVIRCKKWKLEAVKTDAMDIQPQYQSERMATL